MEAELVEAAGLALYALEVMEADERGGRSS